MLHEAKISDYIICASSYTKRTLTEYGIKNDVITVIPYGYNPASVCKSEDKREGFNILYASGICDVILDGENGFIFKAESSIEIKRIIEKCIDDKHMLNVMSKKARIKALEFSEKSYADKIESFLGKIEI